MNQKELKELIEFLIEKDIAEFELERGDVKVRIKRGSEAVAAASARTRATLPCTPRRTSAPSSGCRAGAGGHWLRLRPEKPAAPEEGLAHRALPDRGHVLRVAFARFAAFCKPGDRRSWARYCASWKP